MRYIRSAPSIGITTFNNLLFAEVCNILLILLVGGHFGLGELGNHVRWRIIGVNGCSRVVASSPARAAQLCLLFSEIRPSLLLLLRSGECQSERDQTMHVSIVAYARIKQGWGARGARMPTTDEEKEDESATVAYLNVNCIHFRIVSSLTPTAAALASSACR